MSLQESDCIIRLLYFFDYYNVFVALCIDMNLI